MTELPFVLFHNSQWTFRSTHAFVTIPECIATSVRNRVRSALGRRGRQAALILLLDNDLALHAFVPETARMATLKRISAWRLGQELEHGHFALLELPTVLRGSEN